MSEFNRRHFLEGSASVAAAATLGTGAAVFAPAIHAQTPQFKPEKGAKLRVLRWSRFVQGDISDPGAEVTDLVRAADAVLLSVPEPVALVAIDRLASALRPPFWPRRCAMA